jgi:hypothetical protein
MKAYPHTDLPHQALLAAASLFLFLLGIRGENIPSRQRRT